MNSFWITILSAIIPLWLLQNIIHELSHGLTMWFGWKWKFKIYPFPSKKLGRFTFAHVEYEKTNKSTVPDENGRALTSIMPKIINTLLIILPGIIAVSFKSLEILPAILLVFMWCNFIDFLVGLIAIFRLNKESDIWRFQEYLGIPIKYLKFSIIGLSCWFSIVILLVTFVLLLS